MILLSVSCSSPREKSLLFDLPDLLVFGDKSLLQDELDCFFHKEARVDPVSDKSTSLSKSLSNTAKLFITKGHLFHHSSQTSYC